MIKHVSFYIIPGELNKPRTVISIRDYNKNKIGSVIWNRCKTYHTLSLQPVTGYNLSIPALRDIIDLMQAIESGNIELTEQLIEESQG